MIIFCPLFYSILLIFFLFSVLKFCVNSDNFLSVLRDKLCPSLHLPFNSAYGIFGHAKVVFFFFFNIVKCLNLLLYCIWVLSQSLKASRFLRLQWNSTMLFSSVYMVSLNLSCVGYQILTIIFLVNIYLVPVPLI